MADDPGTLSYVGGKASIEHSFRAPYLVRLWVADQWPGSSVRISLAEVGKVTIGRGELSSHTRNHDGATGVLNIRVADGWMSSRHVELVEEEGQWSIVDCQSKNGSFLNRDRFTQAELQDGDFIHTGNTTFLFRSEVERSHLEQADVDSGHLRGVDMASLTLSLPLARTMANLHQVATSMVPVVLGGETGTGKEVCARALHNASQRQGRFIAINCGALPANLIESELFGHRKGAFSGATSDRVGLIQASDGGTLFLDEVAELPPDAQVKLLRVLQEKEVQPLGAMRPIPINLRVVCATHANLESLVASGHFRGDLYARLAGVSFSLPALRERPEDLGIVLSSLLRRIGGEREYAFERQALWAIALYQWPRNIRELEQALGAALAWAGTKSIELRHLPPAVIAALQPGEESPSDPLCEELKRVLSTHGGNVSAAAREMGKARVQIRRWCKRFGIDPASYR